jgi:hypothetical protein
VKDPTHHATNCPNKQRTNQLKSKL